MSNAPSKARNLRMSIGILALIFVAYSNQNIAASLAQVAESFPDIPQSTVQLFITFGGIGGMISSFASGPLQRAFSQKTILLAAAFLMFLGVIPVFYTQSFWLVAIIVCVLGFASGLLTSVGPSFISMHFTGEARSRMLGLKMTFQGLGMILFTLLGGFLAVYGWQYNYATFFIAGVAFIVGALFLPAGKPVRAGEADENAEGDTDAAAKARAEERGLKASQFMPILSVVIFSVVCMGSAAAVSSISMHCANWGIGDSSISGIAIACASLGMAIGGIVAPRVIGALKTHTVVTMLVGVVISMLLMGFSRDVIMLCAGTLLFGIVYSIMAAQVMNLLSGILKPSAVPMGMALYSGISSLGHSISVPVVNAFSWVFPWEPATDGFFVMAVFIAICVVVCIVSRYEQRASELISKIGA